MQSHHCIWIVRERQLVGYLKLCCCLIIVLLVCVFLLILNLIQYHPWDFDLRREDKAVLLSSLQDIGRALTINNYTYMLTGGALLGSYHHHGLIPGGDSVSIMMSEKQRPAFLAHFDIILPSYRYKYFDVLSENPVIQVYPKESDSLRNSIASFLPVRVPFPTIWPSVEILLWEENSTHVWIVNDGSDAHQEFAKNHIFPLQYRPFEGALYATPCDIPYFLTMEVENYAPGLCTSRAVSHRLKLEIPPVTVRCELLYGIFPFVRREKMDDNFMVESLMLGSQVLDRVEMPLPCTP